MKQTQKSIAILGGGISGLSTGFYLQKLNPSLQFKIFDKNSSVRGGRACTFRKKVDENIDKYFYFDPGANYLSFDDKFQEDLIYNQIFCKDEPDIFLKDLEKINKPIYLLDKNQNIQKSDKQGLKLTYKTGLSKLSENLANGMMEKLVFNSKILSILKNKQNGKWNIQYEDIHNKTTISEEFDIVVSALHPLALQRIQQKNLEEIKKNQLLIQDEQLQDCLNHIKDINFKKIIAVCLDFKISKSIFKENEYKKEFLDFFALLNLDRENDISWMCCENDKPGHIPDLINDSNYDYIHLGLTLQMSNDWSENNMDKDDEYIIQQALNKMLQIIQKEENKQFFNNNLIENAQKIFELNENIKYKWVKKWEYALQTQQNDLNSYIKNQNQNSLYFCGDILYPKSRVSNAFMSGIETAKKMIQTTLKQNL
ncbi:hypothetical protein PPERSA_00472 [Pseudocohnilembus persalinus]|uniref:Amine oxidase domain-containing protein n=1 Tax=Pseudocohnilembus persalinus TaxID=266149 RepID=A0A0V0QIE0_PSEPJ|nr:hypothetical protein PPERSA_00472 [Pseudocohnilembus persalinus]|eukprot:KRX01850.1 hypothetical protein PPERSA_00472 [Pseudocohnilembus persalinus]